MSHYTLVTDAMLTSPPDSDWLMPRRNYQGWSYSPLHDINRQCEESQLKWAWAMNEGGANETHPVVHDGVVFLFNTDNIMQALDARTGKLIWENRIGPRSPHLYGGNRGIALIRTRSLPTPQTPTLWRWTRRPARPRGTSSLGEQRHATTGGVIVVHGKVITGLTGC